MEFKPTWLYVKRCNHCGLLYFGKTTAKRPEKYPGSGVYWRQHLEKHDAQSVHVTARLFKNRDKCIRHALRFSKRYNIAASDAWANLCDEDGTTGGVPGFNMHSAVNPAAGKHWFTDGTFEICTFAFDPIIVERNLVRGRSSKVREASRRAALGNQNKLGYKTPDDVRFMQSISNQGKHQDWVGRKHSAASRKKMRANHRTPNAGTKVYNDGLRRYHLFPNDPRTKSLQPGAGNVGFVSEEARQRISAAHRGKPKTFSKTHRAALSLSATLRKY